MLRSAEPRKRPLRTYGRQQPQNTDDVVEPRATKRRCMSEHGDSHKPTATPVAMQATTSTKSDNRTRDSKSAASELTTKPSTTKPQTQKTLNLSKPAQPVLPSPTPAPTTTKKAMITSYFRVVPHHNSDSSSCADSHVPSSDTCAGANSSPSSPPSSPPPLSFAEKDARARRKPRRLTTKAKPREVSKAKAEDDEDGSDEEGHSAASKSRSVRGTKQESQTPGAPAGQVREALGSTTPFSLNRELATATESSLSPQLSATTNPRKRQRTTTEPVMIQQTLSLSMSEKGFTECKECSMLYNPLHEKDRRLHARQHAKFIKQRAMKEDEDD